MLYFKFNILKGLTLKDLKRWQEAKDHFLLCLKYDPNNKYGAKE